MLSSIVRSRVVKSIAPAMTAVRNLNVHEYQAMEIMAAHGVVVPKSQVSITVVRGSIAPLRI